MKVSYFFMKPQLFSMKINNEKSMNNNEKNSPCVFSEKAVFQKKMKGMVS